VLVTHHVEEIPPSFTDLLALRGGRILRAGTLPDALDDELLSECFDMPLVVEHRHGRWSARRA